MVCGVDTRPLTIACIRVFLAVFNIILGVYSVLLLFCSVAVYLWLHHFLAIGPDLASALPIFLLSLSLSILGLSCLACCCLTRRQAPRSLIYIYSLVLGSIFLVEMITVLVTFLFRERVSQALKEGIYQSMEKYGMSTESNQAVDLLQTKVGCCGVSGHRDWEFTGWGQGHKERLPHSCCHSTSKGVCRVGAEAEVHPEGCHMVLMDIAEYQAFSIVSFLLLTSLVHLAAVAMSVCLARSKEPYQTLT